MLLCVVRCVAFIGCCCVICWKLNIVFVVDECCLTFVVCCLLDVVCCVFVC